MLEHDRGTRRLKWRHCRAADLVDNESPFVPISWLTRVVRLGVLLNRA
jgi:hypothetical protein